MLRLTPFNYQRPTTIEAALVSYQDGNGNAAFMAGGTDLLPNIKHRLASPSVVVGLAGVKDLKTIRRKEDGSLWIGGGVTLWQLQRNDEILQRYPALAQAAALISTPQVQRTGTIGGNICLDVRCNYYNQSEHWRKAIGYCMKKDSEICRVAPGSDRCWAVSSADTVPVLIAYDAKVRIASTQGVRIQDLWQFYRDDGLRPMTLGSGEIVTDVILHDPGPFRVEYSKLRIRMSFDFPLVGAATGISLAEDATVLDSRIVLTAVASQPLRVRAAEEVLSGQTLTPETIRAAGDKIFRATHPMDNTEGAIVHRKRMARIFVERSLEKFAGLQIA